MLGDLDVDGRDCFDSFAELHVLSASRGMVAVQAGGLIPRDESS